LASNFRPPWGVLCIIDASECDIEAINSHSVIQEFVNEVLVAIEMVKIGGLHIHFCDTNDPKKAGLSYFQLLQDSNLSGHFCPRDRNTAYIDLFSCKEYDPVVVKETFQKYFNPQKIHMSTISRQAPE
jgi:S-adenosylmethionine/arginine decarboxylase-like enzyme